MLLREVKQPTYEDCNDDDFMFTGSYNSFKSMSENTIKKAPRKMGYDTKQDICGHGLRTQACSALIESGLWPEDAVELQMSHKKATVSVPLIPTRPNTLINVGRCSSGGLFP